MNRIAAHRPAVQRDHRRDDYGENLEVASILVIDDEPGMRNFLTKILEPRCKRVEQARSAQEASDILDQAHFDLVHSNVSRRFEYIARPFLLSG